MDPANRRRSTRDRPAKAPLSEDAVLEAALSILRTDGLDAVSMRRVATVLDTGAGSLYVYFASRDRLLEAMQDRVIAGVDLERPDPAQWRAQLHSLLHRVHRALVRHPGIAATGLSDPLTSDAALRYLENLLGILLAGGLASQDAAWAADVFSALITHAAIEDDVRRADRDTLGPTLHALFTGLAPDRFPLVTAHADQLVTGDSDERFRFAIDVVVDGLLARAAGR